MTKNDIRKELLNLRKNFVDVSDVIVDEIIKSQVLDNYQKIGIYYPLPYEINLLKLLDTYQNKEFYFPKTLGNDIAFFEVSRGEGFKKGPFHVMEPINNKKTNRDDIEVFIIPCVGIDRSKRRIGYGKGYYDRYLEGYSGLKLAAIHKRCFLDIDVCDVHDVMIDKVFVGE